MGTYQDWAYKTIYAAGYASRALLRPIIRWFLRLADSVVEKLTRLALAVVLFIAFLVVSEYVNSPQGRAAVWGAVQQLTMTVIRAL